MIAAAAVLGALAGPGLILGRARVTLLGGLLALALAAAALALAASGGLPSGLASPPLLAALALAAALPVAIGAALLVRFPAAVPGLLLVAAPIRLPIEISGDNALLVGLAEEGSLGRLYPLYLVLACSVAALGWRALRGAALDRPPLALAAPAAAFTFLVPLSLYWSRDPTAGVLQLLFFWLPFVALLVVVARSPLPRARLLGTLTALAASVFALIGLWQAYTGRLFAFSPKVEAANTYASFFRVTSIFEDPSIYGRHLAVAIAVMLAALWLGRLGPPGATAVIGLLAAGLYFSYSQSSLVALCAGVVFVALAGGSGRGRAVVAGVACVAVAAAIGVIGYAAASGEDSLRRLTSNRSSLVVRTATVFGEHPVLGVGVAAQPLVTRDSTLPGTGKKRNASHTTPLTVGAEYGAVGLVAYLALLVSAFWVCALASRRGERVLGLALAAALVVLVVHSLSYGQFFEDPLTWLVLGLIAAAGARAGSAEPAEESGVERAPVPRAQAGAVAA